MDERKKGKKGSRCLQKDVGIIKTFSTCLIILFALCGCSSSGGIAPDDTSALKPQTMLQPANRWTWDAALYRVTEDHTTIERIDNRSADLHLNVTPFVEPPKCSHCLQIGKPFVQPDGTIKFKVMLTHPFPQQLEYTGFDVRGTIMFPATRDWGTDGWPEPWLYGFNDNGKSYVIYEYIPLRFSLAEDGGGQLLNKDGYTFYLFPGQDLGPKFQLPIFKYSKGVHANGPDPDSTVNGFKLFTNDPVRRMFNADQTITRTYHIAPPAGEFIFGYVVDASWAAPTNMPVTDPMTDFPFWANCEEGYILEWEQTAPFKTGILENKYDIGTVKWLNHLYEEMPVGVVYGYIICRDIAVIPEAVMGKVAQNEYIFGFQYLGEGVYEVKLQIRDADEFSAPPGKYTALLLMTQFNYGGTVPCPYPYPQHFADPPLVDLITLDVVEGD